MMTDREILTSLFNAGVAAVTGEVSVANALGDIDLPRPDCVLALGKASVAMFQGLPSAWQAEVPALIVTKTDHSAGQNFGPQVEVIEASHPVPCHNSLRAGRRAKEFVASVPRMGSLLMLVSGGASSLVEDLVPGVSQEDLLALTGQALAEGVDIAEINRRRRRISTVKGGGLLEGFAGCRVDVLLISDVQGDAIEVIGSGIGACPATAPGFAYSGRVIASNKLAREAVIDAAKGAGLPLIQNSECLYADVGEVARDVAARVQTGPAGLYVFGGEPTVVLPENPGCGGRNQALALELARHFQGQAGITGLVAGTDGTDGPTRAAGGFFDGRSYTLLDGAEAALQAADSGSYLERAGDLFVTGPTGTNVMDLVLVLKRPR